MPPGRTVITLVLALALACSAVSQIFFILILFYSCKSNPVVCYRVKYIFLQPFCERVAIIRQLVSSIL